VLCRFEIETETAVLIQNQTETEPTDENPELHSTSEESWCYR